MPALPDLHSTNMAPVGVQFDADLAAQPVRQFPEGTTCWSRETQTMYAWDPQSTAATVPGVSVAVSTGGAWVAIGSAAIFRQSSVTPYQFGAVGDGIHDDTSAVQAAINSGLMVDLSIGQYRCTATLQLKQSLTVAGYFAGIFGWGRQSKIIVDHVGDGISDSAFGPANFLQLSNFVVENINVGNITGRGIAIDSAWYMYWTRVEVSGFGSDGISLVGGVAGPNISFFKGTQLRAFNNGGSGFALRDQAGATNFELDGWCEFSGNARYGFEQPIVPLFSSQSTIHIKNCGFQGNFLGGIWADLLRGSTFDDNYFENGTNQTVVHMRFGEGVVGAVNGQCNGISITGNYFACTKAAFAISATGNVGSPDFMIFGNRFDGTAGFGTSAIVTKLHQDWDVGPNRLATGWAPVIITGSAADQLGDNLWTNTNTQRSGHLGFATTAQSLIRLYNSVAAANGAQQLSPSLELEGQGWGTTAGTSQAVRAAMQVKPIQAAVPTAELHFYTRIAGGGAVDQGFISSGGLWVPTTAVVLPAGAAQSALSGRIRAPNNVDIITVRNGANGADFGILLVDNNDVVYLVAANGTSFLSVDSPNGRIRAVMAQFQHLLPAGTQVLSVDDPPADTNTCLTIRRNVAGVKSNKLVKFAAAPPGGSQLLYMDP